MVLMNQQSFPGTYGLSKYDEVNEYQRYSMTFNMLHANLCHEKPNVHVVTYQSLNQTNTDHEWKHVPVIRQVAHTHLWPHALYTHQQQYRINHGQYGPTQILSPLLHPKIMATEAHPCP